MGKESYESGKFYERQAVLWLKERGYEILEQNFRSPFGEIDIIARQKSQIVFVEVKYPFRKQMGDAPGSGDQTEKKKNFQYGPVLYDLLLQGKRPAVQV